MIPGRHELVFQCLTIRSVLLVYTSVLNNLTLTWVILNNFLVLQGKSILLFKSNTRKYWNTILWITLQITGVCEKVTSSTFYLWLHLMFSVYSCIVESDIVMYDFSSLQYFCCITWQLFAKWRVAISYQLNFKIFIRIAMQLCNF